jgi:DNA-binding NarL/FixJ family response regulator
MEQCIRVLVTDDHPQSRKGLRALLATCPGVEVICEAENGRQAARLVEDLEPDVVLMDMQMPVWDGFQATRYIKSHWPQVRILALSIHAAWQGAALAAGADAFLLKGCPSHVLFAALHGKIPDHSETETTWADQTEGSATTAECARALQILAGSVLLTA